MTDYHHRRENDREADRQADRQADRKDSPMKIAIIWITAIGGPAAVIATAVFIWNSCSVIVHASDYIKEIPGMQRELSDHGTQIHDLKIGQDYMKEALGRLLDDRGIPRPKEKENE